MDYFLGGYNNPGRVEQHYAQVRHVVDIGSILHSNTIYRCVLGLDSNNKDCRFVCIGFFFGNLGKGFKIINKFVHEQLGK